MTGSKDLSLAGSRGRAPGLPVPQHAQRGIHAEIARQGAFRKKPRHMPHLASGPQPRSCRKGAGSVPACRQYLGPERQFLGALPGSSSRRPNAARPAGRGRPATARICISNWLAGQASIVQWPQLCGRGASSLTRMAPASHRRTARRPSARRDAGRWRCGRRRRVRPRPCAGLMRAGARVTSRM